MLLLFIDILHTPKGGRSWYLQTLRSEERLIPIVVCEATGTLPFPNFQVLYFLVPVPAHTAKMA